MWSYWRLHQWVNYRWTSCSCQLLNASSQHCATLCCRGYFIDLICYADSCIWLMRFLLTRMQGALHSIFCNRLLLNIRGTRCSTTGDRGIILTTLPIIHITIPVTRFEGQNETMDTTDTYMATFYDCSTPWGGRLTVRRELCNVYLNCILLLGRLLYPSFSLEVTNES